MHRIKPRVSPLSSYNDYNLLNFEYVPGALHTLIFATALWGGYFYLCSIDKKSLVRKVN